MSAAVNVGIEAAVSEVWAEVLGRNSIGRSENFFDLGGDSLRAMEVISRLHQKLSLELPLIAFFEDPTIEHLAQVIQELQQGPLPAPQAEPTTQDLIPLSFAQLTFWLMQQREPNSCSYNEARVLRLRGPLRAQVLARSLNEVRRRHEVLRTRFVPNAEEPSQQIDASDDAGLELTDLRARPADVRESAALSLARDAWREPFDLAAGPALRVRLIQLSEDDHLLVVVMHHLISDGHTDALFFNELSVIYGAYAAGRPHELPEPTEQYADHARFERRQIQGPRLDRSLEFWRSQLENAPRLLDLPTDRVRPERPGSGGDVCTAMLAESVVTDLKRLAQTTGTTLFAVLLTGLRIVLLRWCGQQDTVIGTVVGNRSRAGSERLLGCFLNFLPLRHRIGGEQTVLEVLERERALLMEAFAHLECPFVRIAAAMAADRGGADSPLYNVVFLLQNFPELRFAVDGVAAEFRPLPVETALLDLRFIATERLGGLQFDCEFKTELFERATIEQLLRGLCEILAIVATDPAMKIPELPLPEPLLQQAQAARKRDRKQTLAIAATFTAEPVAETLEFWAQQLDIPLRIEFAPYNQVFQQLLDPSSLLAGNRDGINLVLLRMEDWLASSADFKRDAAGLERSLLELISVLRGAARSSVAPLLLCICPPSMRAAADVDFAALLERLERSVTSQLGDIGSIQVISHRDILQLYPVQTCHDEYAEQLGHIPYTPAFFTALGTMVARRLSALLRPPHKVIVLDCDNTLWSGVCAEDGALGVIVDASRRALQEFVLEQLRAGMLLCLCSKNVEEDVEAVFDQNPGMVLRRDQIIASRINWQPKSQNLRELAQELKLGLDSFVFIDDSALECEEVRSHCPEVLTIELPREPGQIRPLLEHVWAFDRSRVTAEDEQRAAFYRASVEREQLRQSAGTLEEFLAGLELRIDIRPAQPSDLARVAQLTQRTNQFNLTTIRRTEAEIAKLRESGAECLVADVADRLGDYGTVGALIYTTEHDCVRADTLLLSCRALGRKVEHRMLARLGEVAQSRHLARVDVPFIATRKNRPALDFLESIGMPYRHGSSDGATFQFPAACAAGAHQLPSADAAGGFECRQRFGAGVHGIGPDTLSVADRATATRCAQHRPRGRVAQETACGGSEGFCCAPHADRGNRGGYLGAPIASRARRHSRQLLCTRRSFAARGTGGGAHSRSAGRAADARSVRCADGGRIGAVDRRRPSDARSAASPGLDAQQPRGPTAAIVRAAAALVPRSARTGQCAI